MIVALSRLSSKPNNNLTNHLNFRLNHKGNKGQVTVFIILGILLLLTLILFIFLRKEIVAISPEEFLPTEKGRIEKIILNCIEQSADEALLRIGNQGGYLDIPETIKADSNLYLKTSPFTMIPYWAYGTKTNIPPLSRIKQEIDTYIEENVRECLFALDLFPEVYDISEKSQPNADTQILDQKIIFNLHWNIEIRDKEGEMITEVINHVTESPIKLKKLHQTAQQIVEREMLTLKLEDITQDLIALEHPKLPLAGTEISCKKKTWKVNEVKSTFQDMLRVNIRKLQVTGTEMLEFPDEFPYYQNHYIWNMGSDFKQEEVSVVFHYDNNYPIIFQVTPMPMSSGQLGGTDILSAICLQVWKFTYDVVYPVTIRVKDETTGYVLNTALTVHLIRNFPNREVFPSARSSLSFSYATDENYCSGMRIPLTVLTWELVENKATGVYDKEPLEDVNVSFTCLKYKCEMGTTEFDFAERGYEAGLAMNFPHCVGGILRGSREGFKEDWVRVVTEPGTLAELELAPLLYFPANKIKVLKHEIEDNRAGSGQEIGSKESAMITLTYRKEDDFPNNPFQEDSLVISPNLDELLLQEQKLKFLAKADFTYELRIDVFDDEDFVGGYRGNWTVPWEELASAAGWEAESRAVSGAESAEEGAGAEPGKELIFHVASTDLRNEEGQFFLLAGLEEFSKLVPPPEFR